MAFLLSDYVTCTIQLISFFAYILVIIFLSHTIKNGGNSNSNEFYIHFIANGIVDILSNVLDILIRRLLTWGLFLSFYESYLWIGNLSPFIYHATLGNCVVGTLIITCNRFMQMHFPFVYKTFWTRKISIMMILFQMITPYLSYIYLFKYEVTLLYSNEQGYWYHSMKDKTASYYNSLIMCIWAGITCIIAFILNLCNIKKYINFIFKKKKSSTFYSSKVYLYTTYSLLISISLFLVFANALFKLYSIIYSIKTFKEMANSNYEWIILLMTCCHPFLILILSKDLRKKFLSFYLNKKSTISTTIIPLKHPSSYINKTIHDHF